MQNNSFKYQKYLITNKFEPAPQTVIFTLAGKLNFEPGQFVQVIIPKVGEATFAPCSSPYNKKTFDLCVRATGNTTNQLVKKVPGDSIHLRGPYGKGWPTGKLIGKNVVIIAGGMGLVPLKSLMFELLKYKKEFKKIYFFGGFKTSHHLLFEKDMLVWQKKFYYFKVAVEKSTRDWWGETCMITDILSKVHLKPKNTIVLMCGPEVMLPYCNQVIKSKKIPARNIYISFERRIECGIGLCQHCNIGKYLVCKDGPVFRWDIIKPELDK